jgi:hypothetical protein
LNRFSLSFIFVLTGSFYQLTGQSLEETIRIKDSIYQSQVNKVRIDGVYIPKDVVDAMKELDRLSPPESVAKLKQTDEETVAKKLHFGLGRWMAVNWQLNFGSRLSAYLSNLGLMNEDEMTRFLLITYHRHIMKKDLQSTELARSIKEKREAEYRKQMKELHGIDSVIIKN